MRARRRVGFYTALPFLALFAASSVSLRTHVEDDGTAMREVTATATASRGTAVKGPLERMEPKDLWVNRQDVTTPDTCRFSHDARLVRASEIGGLSIVRALRFGFWPLAATTYTYTDKITRSDFADEPKEQQGAAATEFEYSVTMPGRIDDTSITPPGGVLEGSTVTWKLKADKDVQEVSVRSEEPVAMFAVVVVYAILALVALGLRFGLAQQRQKPIKI